jgi:hypothetical protein
MKPLCPLVEPRHRLEVSIVETHREGGKVRQKYIASLGSIAGDSPAERGRFWHECEARLERLSNRLGPDLDRLRQAIAARIPPVTDAERETMDHVKWDELEENWAWLRKRDIDEIKRCREQVQKSRATAEKLEAIIAAIKDARATGAKFQDTPGVTELNDLYPVAAGFIDPRLAPERYQQNLDGTWAIRRSGTPER